MKRFTVGDLVRLKGQLRPVMEVGEYDEVAQARYCGWSDRGVEQSGMFPEPDLELVRPLRERALNPSGCDQGTDVGVPSSPTLPPLPHHTPRGLQVEAGDTVAVRNCTISLTSPDDNLTESSPPIPVSIPDWADGCVAGATFRLRGRLPTEELRFSVDADKVYIPSTGTSIEVGLRRLDADHHLNDNHHLTASRLATRALDVAAAELSYLNDLDAPLREYALWTRHGGKTMLRYVATTRLAFGMRMHAVVLDKDGEERQQPKLEHHWHPSYAYFRRSQTTDHLCDAYRNLFLALEALLSEVYPKSHHDGESEWLKKSLRHVMEGYGLCLTNYLSTSNGNPYKRFMKEQYAARRCALFHAKVSHNSTLPCDLSVRDELMDATGRLGRLYSDLSRLITGAPFPAGSGSDTTFDTMMRAMLNEVEGFIADGQEGNALEACRVPAEYLGRLSARHPVYGVKTVWHMNGLSARKLRRAGTIARLQGVVQECSWTEVDIDTRDVDVLEIVFQTEFLNEKSLRQWYL